MKVSKKVGRRSRKHTSSSVSRRRLRNKNKKSSYRKKHTQRGGKRGKCTRTRSRGYKRGKRFHRGGMSDDSDDDEPLGEPGVFALPPLPKKIQLKIIAPNPNPPTRPGLLTGDEDIEPGLELEPTIVSRKLPEGIDRDNYIGTFSLDFKRTDGRHKFNPLPPTEKPFDVFVVKDHRGNASGIYLLRYSDTENDKYIKKIFVIIGKLMRVNSMQGLPFSNLESSDPYTESSDGTYTFPKTDTNETNFKRILINDKVVVV